jgi:hypothetical protein
VRHWALQGMGLREMHGLLGQKIIFIFLRVFRVFSAAALRIHFLKFLKNVE